jgi:beta-glucosidase
MPFLFVLLLLLSYPTFAQDTLKHSADYLHTSLPTEKRVQDLISRLTLEEKISQMINSSSAIPRLQIPEYDWWNECLHGVARAGTATVFPQAIGLAAMWDTDLMYTVADVISTEARAKYNDFIQKGERGIFKGLTFWTPNINIFRDPRWGRGQETYGEDPYLTSRLGVAFVKGLQGNDPVYFKVIATPKHYAVHSGPEPSRHTFDAIINNRDLYETYLPAFEACIKEAGAYSVMCAYNRFMGEACCGSPTLLHKILREDWNFGGYVVSDCGAIDDIFKNHRVVKTAPEAAALAVKSGTDLECGRVYQFALLEAVRLGLLTEDEINIAIRRLFTARFKLGMFDPPAQVPYSRISIDQNDSQEHRALALRAAQESIVLLKNENSILPIRKDLTRIAVIGPTADSYSMLLGNYNGTPSKYVTPLHGIKDKVQPKTEVVYEQGCDLVDPSRIITNIPPEIFSFNKSSELQIDYFKNRDLQGNPFFTRTSNVSNANWVYDAKLPSFPGVNDFHSLRWSGYIKVPDTGVYDFFIKSDGGFRLSIDDKKVLEDWSEHEFSTNNVRIPLEKEKDHKFTLEYYVSSRRPQLILQWGRSDINHTEHALALAKSADLVIFIGGITAQLEGEEMRVDYEGFKGGDRTDLNLPKVQQQLLESLHSLGKPIVLVLTSGSSLAVNWANEHLPAILQLWYPGEEGGTALADVLFGDYNPAGRLPITFYKSIDQLPPFEEYAMAGRTYRYMSGDPLFTFGYGLSYTQFKYSNLILPDQVHTDDSVVVSAEIKNAGTMAGDEVVQLYVKNRTSSVPVPIRSLQGFMRIHLNSGENQTVTFILHPKQFAVHDDAMNLVVQPTSFEISVGGVLPGIKASTTESLSKIITLTGSPYTIK